MKGMILAAGFGTRMGPISDYMAKPAVPFLGVPMIEHSIAVLRSAGITDMVINLHHKPETLKDLLKDGKHLGVSIEYSFEDPILGSGGGIGKARKLLEEDTFVVLNSDVMIDVDVAGVIEAHKAAEADATLLLRPDPQQRYGKVVVDGTGRVRKIEGHPEALDFHGGQPYMFGGLHVIEPCWFEFTPDKDYFESFPEVYGPMILAGKNINSYIFEGRWIDIGSARRLLNATTEHLIRSIVPNSVALGEKVQYNSCVFSANTRIGSNSRLENIITIGACEIGSNCTLANCIVCPGAKVPSSTEASDKILYEETSLDIDQLRE